MHVGITILFYTRYLLYGTYLFYDVKERRRKYRNQICIIAALS